MHFKMEKGGEQVLIVFILTSLFSRVERLLERSQRKFSTANEGFHILKENFDTRSLTVLSDVGKYCLHLRVQNECNLESIMIGDWDEME
jgi:hypothetical protein